MSKSSYKQILKKIYDDERGREVIECLHEHPYLTIPVVLKRLKQKDEEWRRSQVRLYCHLVFTFFSVNGTKFGARLMERTFTNLLTIKELTSRMLTRSTYHRRVLFRKLKQFTALN